MGKQAGIKEVPIGTNGGLVFHKAGNKEGEVDGLEKSKNKNKELRMSLGFSEGQYI